MREGEYVDSLIDEYETLLAQKTLKNSWGEYNESEILKGTALGSGLDGLLPKS